MRNVFIGTAAAFAGGGLVVALQALVAMAGAQYPPIVQGLHCNFTRQSTAGADQVEAELGEGGGDPTAPAAEENGADPLADPSAPTTTQSPTITAGDKISCYLDAPGADYAAWAVAGRTLQFRSGQIDLALPCQDATAFAAQSPDDLRVSACQSFRLSEPGDYHLVMKVMARGSAAVDREQMRFHVLPAPQSANAPAAARAAEAPVATRLKTTLLLPAHQLMETRSAAVSETLREHGLLPSSRDFSLVVYRLARDETYVSSRFIANSASEASKTRVAYQPRSRNVVMSFTLRSGPLFDQWRGWISGNVVVRVKRDDAAQTVDLPDIDLQLPGESRLALPDNIAADRLQDAKLRLVRSETNTSVEAGLGQTVTLDDAAITPTLVDRTIVIAAHHRAAGGGTK
jgi:hypothetical protein